MSNTIYARNVKAVNKNFVVKLAKKHNVSEKVVIDQLLDKARKEGVTLGLTNTTSNTRTTVRRAGSSTAGKLRNKKAGAKAGIGRSVRNNNSVKATASTKAKAAKTK